MTVPATPEQVVLLDERGNAIGATDKETVHHTDTPLHLAFSCYVFDSRGALLVTQRAHHKRTWPGAWTNTFCGHPAPGEALEAAVRRRAQQELGIDLEALAVVLPRFRYRAEMPDGTVENEMCPVFCGIADGPARPDAAEVAAVERVPWSEFRASVLSGTREVSPWCVEQVRELPERPWELHDDTLRSALPPAAVPGRG